jgi:ketosteroid isomerase-like protein
MSPEEELRGLNAASVQASLKGDVEWYHLAEDFLCVESDGSVLDKAAFLRMSARGSALATYRLDEVAVRRYGDVALVRATGSWTSQHGTPGMSRYVDVYVRSGDGWRVVSAQITRPADRGAR